jgi:hypothetical protein
MDNGPGGENARAVEERSASRRQDDNAARVERTEPSFRAYVAARYELIPLHAPDDLDPKGRKVGKAPLHKKWRTLPALSVATALDHLRRGGNVGVRLRETDLVVDVDPRNFVDGDDPLARLEKDLGIDLRAICPTVVTGSNGLHLYLRKPSGFEVRDSLENYQGVEFKTFGRQVVAPGSIHPDTHGVYTIDVLSIGIDEAPEASQELLGMIRRPEVHQGDTAAGDLEPEALAEMLAVLDATHYQDQGKWLEMMMACHHATGGNGRQEFIDWSTSDPAFANDAWIIGRRWDSLHADNKGRRVTKKTLFRAVLDAGKAAETSYDHLLPQPERTTAREDFAEFIEGDVVEDLPAIRPPHERGLATNGRDVAIDTLSNAMAAVHAMGIAPAFDELRQAVVFQGRLPWEETFGRTLDDHTARRLRGAMIERYQGVAFEPSKDNVFEACHTLAYQHRFNPVLDYLAGLEWDGVERVATLFSRYFRVPDDAYSRAVARCFMVASVRRQRQPGVKFDTMPVLRGKQGTMKSTGVKALFGADWFSDADLGNLTNKDAPLLLHNIWVQEMAELQALRRADAETLKAFCSRAVDRVRPPYGRSVIDIPRRCVFIGTANEGGYLVDPTGNRRFWPLEVLAEVDVEGLGRDRDQLWAEAAAMEAARASIVLDRDLWALAAERQAEETTEDPWADQVRRLIDARRLRWTDEDETDVPADDRFQTWELFDALGIPTTQQTRGASQRLKVVMTETLGWSHRRGVRIGHAVSAGFVRWPDDKGPMPEGSGGPF